MTWPFYPHDYAAGEIKSRWEGQPLSLSLFCSLSVVTDLLCARHSGTMWTRSSPRMLLSEILALMLSPTEILIGLTWSIYWVAGPLYWVRAIDWLYVSQVLRSWLYTSMAQLCADEVTYLLQTHRFYFSCQHPFWYFQRLGVNLTATMWEDSCKKGRSEAVQHHGVILMSRISWCLFMHHMQVQSRVATNKYTWSWWYYHAL